MDAHALLTDVIFQSTKPDIVCLIYSEDQVFMEDLLDKLGRISAIIPAHKSVVSPSHTTYTWYTGGRLDIAQSMENLAGVPYKIALIDESIGIENVLLVREKIANKVNVGITLH